MQRPRSDVAVGGVGPVEHYRVSGQSRLSGLSGNCRGVLDSARTWCLSRNILFAVGGCRATVGAVGCRGCRDCRAAVGIMSGVGVGVSGQGSGIQANNGAETYQRVARQWPDSGPTAPDRARHPDSQGSRTQVLRSDTSDTPDTSDTLDTPTLDTPTRSDTTHASPCPTTLRHRSDTGQTPPTPSTPVSIDTAPTLLRHYSDTSDTSDSDTQTHQASKH